MEETVANGFDAATYRTNLQAGLQNARAETMGQIAEFRQTLVKMHRQLQFRALQNLAEAESDAEALSQQAANVAGTVSAKR